MYIMSINIIILYLYTKMYTLYFIKPAFRFRTMATKNLRPSTDCATVNRIRAENTSLRINTLRPHGPNRCRNPTSGFSATENGGAVTGEHNFAAVSVWSSVRRRWVGETRDSTAAAVAAEEHARPRLRSNRGRLAAVFFLGCSPKTAQQLTRVAHVHPSIRACAQPRTHCTHTHTHCTMRCSGRRHPVATAVVLLYLAGKSNRYTILVWYFLQSPPRVHCTVPSSAS